ncbi:MAG: hypothetical protein IJX13_08565, partial [Clostridia bacterium]|nr:hypothetical protein [Clostridia bacterium]
FGITYGIDSGVRCEYIQKSGGDILLFSDRGKAVAVDFTDGSADGASTLVSEAYVAQCTELETLIISHYHNMASHFIDVVAGGIKVRSIRLPTPQSEWESAVAKRLVQEAEVHGIEVRFDMDELPIRELNLQILDHELFESDRHTALLLSATANGKTAVYANSSIPDSTLFPLAKNFMRNADLFILGDTGYKSASPTAFPVLSDKTETVILAKEKLRRLLPLLERRSDVIIAPPLHLFYLR